MRAFTYVQLAGLLTLVQVRLSFLFFASLLFILSTISEMLVPTVSKHWDILKNLNLKNDFVLLNVLLVSSFRQIKNVRESENENKRKSNLG